MCFGQAVKARQNVTATYERDIPEIEWCIHTAKNQLANDTTA